MQVTRRSIARMLAAAAAVPQAAIPQASTSQTPPPDADLNSAREQMKAYAQQIAKVKLPMPTEPAFHFKA